MTKAEIVAKMADEAGIGVCLDMGENPTILYDRKRQVAFSGHLKAFFFLAFRRTLAG